MMLLAVPLVALLAGLAVWPAGRAWSRTALGAAALGTVVVVGALLAAAVATGATFAASWGGPLAVTLAVTDAVAVAAGTVVVVTLAVVAYAVGHEDERGLSRLVGLLVAFAGAMLLLVLAADLLTLLLGFELTAAASWALIAHDWRGTDGPAGAAHAFTVTRLGSLGLLVAAGAALAGTGALGFATLGGLSGWPLHAFAAGVLVAAATKSALVPFSPWLFSAMAGPSSVSALLHSATMVAAGAWVLIRLHEPLVGAPWFGPAAVGLGLVTAVTGGVVAAVQPRAKQLLAASTSAHYGLMVAAVGAGAAGAALLHLVAHAAAKALLFLAAGLALSATGSPLLADHRLGRWRGAAAAAWVGALALAAVPPLGAALTKEKVVAGLGHLHPAAAVVAAVAGGLSAFAALRFAVLAYGRAQPDPRELDDHRPGGPERLGLGALAGASLLLGVLWVVPRTALQDLTGLPVAAGAPWEAALSLALVAGGALAVRALHRRGRLASLTDVPAARLASADWLGLPALGRRLVVDPVLALASGAARFDDRVVDAGVRRAGRAGEALARVWSRTLDAGADALVEAVAAATAVLASASVAVDERGVDAAVDGAAAAVGEAGRDVRRTQTGLVHHYYAYVVGGLVATVAVLALLR